MQVGILRLMDVVQKSQLGQATEKRLEQELEAANQDVTSRQRNLMKLEAEARKFNDVGEAHAKRYEVEKLSRELEFSKNEAQIRLEEHRRQLLAEVLDQVQPLVADMAKEKDLDLVMLWPNPQLAYFKSTLDITDEVIARLDAAGRAPAAKR